MSRRFGQYKWDDADRLNLLKIYQEHPNWAQRTKAMQTVCPIYTNFTEPVCIEEFERILKEPTPNLRSNVPDTFVYSRSIQVEKWLEYFEVKVEKQLEMLGKTTLSNINQRISKTIEVLTGSLGEEMMNENVKAVYSNPLMKDPEYRRQFAKVQAAVSEQLEKRGLHEIIDSLKSLVSTNSSLAPEMLPLSEVSIETAPLSSVPIATPEPVNVTNMELENLQRDVTPTASTRHAKGKRTQGPNTNNAEKKTRYNL